MTRRSSSRRDGVTPVGEATKPTEWPEGDPAAPPSSDQEATEGFVTEVESLAPGVAPTEPRTFATED